MTSTVHVQAPGAPYDVDIGTGVLDEIGPMIRHLTQAQSIALVTDETVAALFGMKVDTGLARQGFRVLSLTVPAGESSKSWAVAGDLCEALAAGGLSRTDVVVALGGGVVGDLAGFAAAVYLRGIDFVQVPTTLLGMVDSSVGGKTAVDLRAGKNLAGAFKQPLGVIADMSTLSTLPEAEWRSGLAEVAKTALLEGETFLAWLEEHTAADRCERRSDSQRDGRALRLLQGRRGGTRREGGGSAGVPELRAHSRARRSRR